ncbi:MAG: glycosyltransferase [Holosporaceae bacterium]|jgi:glycosyltransferase involved in cell wall biosynthesis|nr:glycosyltransferase [Holosporaceae bacterium]
MSLADFPKVTVITVVRDLIKFKRKEFFLQCLESVHEQTYPNIEHIIIDGASTDGTLDLLKEYAATGWIEYYSEPDNGIYYAMNKGICKSTGKYINFLNSDDYFCDTFGLERSVELLEDSGAVFSYSKVYFSHNGEKISLMPNKIERFFFNMPFCHQGTLMRKDALVNEGMFDTGLKSASDYDLLIRLIIKGCNCIPIDIIFTVFRGGGFSSEYKSLSDGECQKIQKKYFPMMESKRKRSYGLEYTEHYITKDQLENIKSSVNEEISKRISELKTKKLTDGRLRINSGAYFDFLIKRYYFCGIIPILTLKQRTILYAKSEKIWSLGGARIFRIRETRYNKVYFFLNIPIFMVAHNHGSSFWNYLRKFIATLKK